MGIFDVFDSSSGKTAATNSYNAYTAALDTGYGAATDYYGQANAALTTGATDANKALYETTNKSQEALDYGQENAGAYYGTATDYLSQGATDAYGYIDTGTGQATDLYGQAQGYYDPLAAIANAGYSSYANATGVNGQTGYDQAVSSFQTSPGYEFEQQQGLDALNRQANSRGMLSSGNNTQDILEYSQGLADQQWDDYLASLSGYGDQAISIAGSQAGLATGLADVYTNAGTSKANVATGTAAAQATNATNQANTTYQYGADTAGLLSQYGTDTANVATNTAAGQAQTAEDLAALTYGYYGQQGQAESDLYANKYAAEQGASQNYWDVILGMADNAAKAAGTAAASDRRIKTDISKVGQLDNGLPVYLFRFKNGGPFQIGLMAQDVEQVNPSAVVEHDGVKYVRYSDAVSTDG